jgi:hypothetical protein
VLSSAVSRCSWFSWNYQFQFEERFLHQANVNQTVLVPLSQTYSRNRLNLVMFTKSLCFLTGLLVFCSCSNELENKIKATLLDSAKVYNLDIVYLEAPETYTKTDSLNHLRHLITEELRIEKICPGLSTNRYYRNEHTSDSLYQRMRDSILTKILDTRLGEDSTEIQGYWTYVSFKDSHDQKWDYKVYFTKDLTLLNFQLLN